MHVPVSIRTSNFKADRKALVDSGATDNFIHPDFIKRMGLGTKELDRHRNIWNIDGTHNKGGKITHCVDLNVQTDGKIKDIRFLVTNVGGEDLILGYPWLATFQPRIEWATATMDTKQYPIIIRTTHPLRPFNLDDAKSNLRRIMTHIEDYNKQQILQELEEESLPIHLRTTATELAVAAGQGTRTTTIPNEYKRHAKVFSEEESHRFPPPRPWDHEIALKPEAPDHIDCKVYPLNQTEDKALEEFLDEQLAKGYIRPSKSQYAAPFFFVKKKDGKLRPVQDYRDLNKWTIRNQYPLPLIPKLITDLSGAWIFSKFDIRWGYTNVRIKPGDEHKGAFKTRRGFFEPLVMFFGMTNAPATFQAMMDHTLKPTIAKHELKGTIIRVYMDDIAVATSSTEQAHTEAIHDILDVLELHDLYLKLEKCTFHSSSLDYLGVIIEKGVIRMDPTKVSGIRDWPTPKTVKQVRSFLGFCNFYRAFIRNFATHARPLNKLTRKDTDWQWGTEQSQAFDKLKILVTEEPVLKHPELDKPFELEVDASGYAVGAVLLQRGPDGKRHPIAFYSNTLNTAERNYDIYDLELLAIVKALRNWRQYLAGSPHKIKVFSDHMNLQYWRAPQKISRRVAREVLELSEYDIEIHHIKGTANGRADALSRRPDYDQGEHDNEQVTVLPDHVFVRAAEIDTTNDPTRMQPTINVTEMQPTNPVYTQDEETLKKWVDPHRLKRIEGTWYKDGRRVVTGDQHERRRIIQAHHDPPVHGHPGISRTNKMVERYYWWPGLRQEVMDYVKGCADCQRIKVNNRPTKAPLQPIFPKPEATPFETIALDFITKLPEADDCDSILTITDHDCSKAAIFIPCREEISAEGTAALYVKHVFSRFGLPARIISDRDPRFASKFTRELCQILGIEQNISTAYHPRTDGQSERTNQWLEQYLRFWVNERQDNWTQYLPMAEFTHNNWPNESTRESPFNILMGYNPRADWIDRPSPIPQVALRVKQFKEARSRAQELMIKAQQKWIKHKDTPKYQEGDLVWLEGRHLRTNQPTTKLAPRRHGPFRVTQVMSAVNYRLELPTQWSIHPVFHTDLLTPYRETPTHGPNYQRPPPDLIDGEEEYEVEKILDSRRFGRTKKLQYLVKWRGYPDSDNQWISKDDVFADDAIREFKRSNPAREVHISAGISKETSSFPTLLLPSPLTTTDARSRSPLCPRRPTPLYNPTYRHHSGRATITSATCRSPSTTKSSGYPRTIPSSFADPHCHLFTSWVSSGLRAHATSVPYRRGCATREGPSIRPVPLGRALSAQPTPHIRKPPHHEPPRNPSAMHHQRGTNPYATGCSTSAAPIPSRGTQSNFPAASGNAATSRIQVQQGSPLHPFPDTRRSGETAPSSLYAARIHGGPLRPRLPTRQRPTVREVGARQPRLRLPRHAHLHRRRPGLPRPGQLHPRVHQPGSAGDERPHTDRGGAPIPLPSGRLHREGDRTPQEDRGAGQALRPPPPMRLQTAARKRHRPHRGGAGLLSSGSRGRTTGCRVEGGDPAWSIRGIDHRKGVMLRFGLTDASGREVDTDVQGYDTASAVYRHGLSRISQPGKLRHM